MSRYYPVKNSRTNEKVKRFFSEKKDTLVLSCLEGTMGCVYTLPKLLLQFWGIFVSLQERQIWREPYFGRDAMERNSEL